jgi:hypothetical protein
MLAAVSAWKGLAAELRATALLYASALSGLSSEEWQGAASAAMVDAATPYVTWMSTTAVQAEQTAAQAEAAAAAYEAAFAATVAPPVIAGQSCPADGADRHQHPRSKHPRDRGHRSPVHGNVGPRRRGAGRPVVGTAELDRPRTVAQPAVLDVGGHTNGAPAGGGSRHAPSGAGQHGRSRLRPRRAPIRLPSQLRGTPTRRRIAGQQLTLAPTAAAFEQLFSRSLRLGFTGEPGAR